MALSCVNICPVDEVIVFIDDMWFRIYFKVWTFVTTVMNYRAPKMSS
jgi:hypothetical protein